MMFSSLPFIDLDTGRAAVHTDQWSKLFQYARELYEIPGNEHTILGAETFFIDRQTLAMMLAPNLLQALGDTFAWDLTTLPILEEAPNTGRASFGLAMAVTAPSENKDAAIQVIFTMLSEEAQIQMARNGRPGVLKDSEWRNVFGENLSLESKRIHDVLDSSSSTNPIEVTKYDQMARQIMLQAILTYGEQGVNLDKTLQTAQEQINQYIDAWED